MSTRAGSVEHGLSEFGPVLTVSSIFSTLLVSTFEGFNRTTFPSNDCVESPYSSEFNRIMASQQSRIVVAVVGVAVGTEEQSFVEIGFRRPTWIDLGYMFAMIVAALLMFAGTDPVVTALGLPVAGESERMAAGVGVGAALAGAVTTGIVEEILVRGYPIERLLAYRDGPSSPVASRGACSPRHTQQSGR